MRKYLTISEEAVSHICLCNCSIQNFSLYEGNFIFFFCSVLWNHRPRIPSPPPLCVAKTGRNNLNEDSTPLLPTGIGERF